MSGVRRPSRIGLAIESSGPGGAENVVLRLAAGLRAAGDDPVIITLRPGWMTERAEKAGFEVWIAPQPPGLPLGWVLRFAHRLRRGRIDCLHSHEFAMNAFGGAAACLAGIRNVATIHGRNWALGAPRRVAAYRLLRRFGMRIVAVSHDLAGFLAQGFRLPTSALSVVHNGIVVPGRGADTGRTARSADARSALGIPPAGPLLVAVGNLYPVKDHATLLSAVSTLPGVRVAIAGRGEEEARLRLQSDTLGITDRVHLLGLRDDVDRVLAAGDVFVQPSRSEGLPLAILEAMANALPVVATRVGGVPEAVVDGETGRLVPPADPASLAGALREVLASHELRTTMGERGRARVQAEFSLERMTSAYRALYAGESLPATPAESIEPRDPSAAR